MSSSDSPCQSASSSPSKFQQQPSPGNVSAASSAIMIDESDVQLAEEDHQKKLEQLEESRNNNSNQLVPQPQQPQPQLIDRVSIFAVRLSGKMAEKLLSAVATAGLISTVAPESVVQATTLVADVHAHATYQLASSLLVHIPSDAITVKLIKKLVTQYATVNPACLSDIGKLTPGAAAATSALGGVLPMLVAAALQESVEVSRLVAGSSTKEQFAIASAHVAAQVAGGVAGLAVGASVGTMVLPGLGTGIGSVAGSWVGATLFPMMMPAQNNTSKNTTTGEDQQQKQIESRADDTGAAAAAASTASNKKKKDGDDDDDFEEIPAVFQHRDNQMHFFWVEEVTSDGFVLINPQTLIEGDDEEQEQQQKKDADAERKGTQKTPEQLRKDFEDTARALLHRATVVPMSHVVASVSVSPIAAAPGASSASSSSPVPSLSPEEQSRRAFQLIDQLPGTVLMLQSNATSMATFSQQSRSRTPSSRIFFQSHQEGDDEQAAEKKEPRLLADIGGRMWGSVVGGDSK